MVSFIPNSLPVTVAVALLIMVRRMQSAQVLVKKLSVVESFSAVNMLACDKTGTLTRNTMTLASVSVGIDTIDLVEIKRRGLVGSRAKLGLQQLVKACAVCNSSRYEIRETASDTKEENASRYEPMLVGNATDVALARFVGEFDANDGGNMETVQTEYEQLAEVAFRSENKWMMRVVRPKVAVKCPFRKSSYADVCIYSHCCYFLHYLQFHFLASFIPRFFCYQG